MPITECPKCNNIDKVISKLTTTNLKILGKHVEQFEVIDEKAFINSPYSDGGYFINALYCNRCELCFVPEAISIDMGVGENQIRGSLLPPWPLNIGGITEDPK